MENRRFMLLALLGVIVYFLYQAWQTDFAPKPGAQAPQAQAQIGTTPTPPGTTQPSAKPGPGDVPSPILAPTPVDSTGGTAGGTVRIVTDVLAMDIALKGGEVRRIELLNYPLSKKDPTVPLPLLDDGLHDHYFVLQSGLAGVEHPFATGETVYTAAAPEAKLADGANAVEIALSAHDDRGFTVTKTFRLSRGSYRIELEQTLQNDTAAAATASPFATFVRNATIVGDQSKAASTSTGVGFYQQSGPKTYKFKNVALKKLDDEKINTTQTGGWIVMLQHYFVAAILPPEDATNTFSAANAADKKTFSAQYVGAGVNVAAGAQQKFLTAFYIGPKLQDGLVPPEGAHGAWTSYFKSNGLDTVAPGLDYTVNYGIFTPICEPLFWVMLKFHKLTGNWGVSIILLTLVVKALFYKLSEAQYRSMAKMKKFGPRIQELKERYAGDRERQSKAMMDLYKKEGFNPLAGCWPLLVQFPVFISLYWVLLESVELRQADFALWINDLSAPDPYYVLPVLFGISFYIQQKWSGSTATMDPAQQKVMNAMPIIMTAFFAFFQSGLVLYWFVSNLIGMAQQWLINKRLSKEGLGRKANPA